MIKPIEEKWKGSWDRAVEDLSGIYYKKNREEWYKELEEHINWLVTAQFMENPYKFEEESPLVTRKKQEIKALFSKAIASAVEARESKIGEHILAIGHNDECMFCGFKDKFAKSIINPSKE